MAGVARAAGALILGKTVSTEFAWFHPGKTANPRNPQHTPGGSSGSAAAVAERPAAPNDPALLARRAPALQCAGLAGGGPIPAQLLAVLLVGVVIGQLFTGGTKIEVVCRA